MLPVTRRSPHPDGQNANTYFKSHYVRTPGGALFELAVTDDEGGWDCDEPAEELGKNFMLPPQSESERESILARLEPVTTD